MGMYHWFAMDIQRTLQSLEEDRDEPGLTGDRLQQAQEELEWIGALWGKLDRVIEQKAQDMIAAA